MAEKRIEKCQSNFKQVKAELKKCNPNYKDLTAHIIGSHEGFANATYNDTVVQVIQTQDTQGISNATVNATLPNATMPNGTTPIANVTVPNNSSVVSTQNTTNTTSNSSSTANTTIPIPPNANTTLPTNATAGSNVTVTTGDASGNATIFNTTTTGNGTFTNVTIANGTETITNATTESTTVAAFAAITRLRRARQRVLRAKGLQILSGMILPSVHLMRTSLCVLCMDPSQSEPSIWDEAGRVPIVHKEALDPIREAINKALNDFRILGTECVAVIEEEVKAQTQNSTNITVATNTTNSTNTTEASTSTCPGAETLLGTLNSTVVPCSSEQDCLTKGNTTVTHAYNINGLEVTTDDGSTVLVATLRRMLATGFREDPTKGFKGVKDQVEDNQIPVAFGFSVEGAKQEMQQAQEEFNAAKANPDINVEEEDDAEDGKAGKNTQLIQIGVVMLILVIFL